MGAVLFKVFRSFVANRSQNFLPNGGVVRTLVVIGLALLAAVALLWTFDKLLLYYTARNYIDEIAWTFNINRHLAEAMALALFVLLVYVLSKTTSLDRGTRRIGILGTAALLVTNSLILWQGTKNQYFDKVGGSTKCYVLTRDGKVKYLERAGIDPDTGRLCRPYTADMLERLQQYEKGKRPERIVSDDPQFFDPRTGEPIVWFAKTPTGEIELFNLMGFHPDSGGDLQAISRDMVEVYKTQSAERNRRAPTLVNPDSYQPFDPITGKPRMWYWKSAAGDYEFFDNRGFHPKTGEPLILITNDALNDYRTRSAQRCFILTRDSVRYGSVAGVDPKSGRVCRDLTDGLRERVSEYEKGSRPKLVSVDAPTFFDLRSGDPALWFSRDSKGGIRLFDLMGFDPDTGDELLPVTKDIPEKWKAQIAKRRAEDERRRKPPQPIDPDRFAFFDPATGDPRVWYWRSSAGDYEFFDNQGFHPRTGEPLVVITGEVIAAWKRDSEASEKRRREGALRDQELRLKAEARAQQEARSGELCDQMAANPMDARKSSNVAGVRWEELRGRVAEAVDTCRIAAERFPNELRYQYQYARALGVNAPDRAVPILRQLTRQRYPAAFDNLGSLLLRNKDYNGAVAVLKEGVKLDDADSMVTLAELVEKGYSPSQNPATAKIALLSRAAQLGHPGAQLAVEQEQEKLRQAQQERVSQQQQQQIQQQQQQQQQRMMMDLFGTVLRGVAR